MNLSENSVYGRKVGNPLQTALDEIANLPKRNDWPIKTKLLGFNVAMGVVCLLGIPLGFSIARMEPANTLLPISAFGFVLIVAAPIGLVYFFGKAVYYFFKPFDALTLFEYFIPNALNYRLDERYIGKMTVPLQLILPSNRDKYDAFYWFSREICEREVRRQGGGFIDCKRWKVLTQPKTHHATCVVNLVRTQLGGFGDSDTSEPLGKITLEAVKSNSGNWYIILPNTETVESWLQFNRVK